MVAYCGAGVDGGIMWRTYLVGSWEGKVQAVCQLCQFAELWFSQNDKVGGVAAV